MTEATPIDMAPAGVKMAKAPFSDVLLVCAKCQRKFKGAGKPVAKQLRRELKGGRWGRVRVVETKCFDLCPKRRQVLASHRTLADHRLLVVEGGFAPEAALEALLGPPRTFARSDTLAETVAVADPTSLPG
jgi:hypothetical protein